MSEKDSKKQSPDIIKEDQTSSELYELELDKMDFDIVKKILSDHIAEEVFIDEETEVSEDKRFLELVVESLEEGLKKASNLLGVPIKELKFKIIEKVLKSIDDKIVEFQRIEFRRKLVSGKAQIKISEDKLSAFLSTIFPKTIDDEEIDENLIKTIIKDEGIKFGIQNDEIKNTVVKLKENYDALTNIIIAKGKPPVDGEDCEISYSIFSNPEEINYNETKGKYLLELLKGSSIKTIKENYFPAMHVAKGDLIVSTTEPGDGEDGTDVFGNKIKAEKGRVLFRTGKNVMVKIEEGRINYYAEMFGYLEYEDGALNVFPPVWISQDFMEAYFIGLPAIGKNNKKLVAGELYDIMNDLGIKYGIIADKVEKVVTSGKERRHLFIKLIAAGEREKKGDDAKIELFFEEDKQAGKILKDGRMDFREIDLIKTVKENQMIAAYYPPKEGAPGKNMKGVIIPAPKGEDRKLSALNNVKTVKGKNRTSYYSTIEGRVVQVGDSGISVNQLFEVKGNIDFSTGNVEFNGNVDIKGSVMNGFKVKAEGDITVKGMVNQGVTLESNGNINVKQGIIGRNNDTILTAKGSIIAQFAQSVILVSGADIIARDYIMNSYVRARGKIITPDKDSPHKGAGSLVGGEFMAIKGIIANSIGSDLAKMTKVTVGVDYEIDKKTKNFNKGLEFCDREVSKLSKMLRLGFNDIDVLKERIAKLPKEKQKPFLEAFAKLSEVSQLKNEIVKKRDKLFKETDELSRNAEILAKKELFPRVNVQIGELKLNTDNLHRGARLKESKNRKNIEILSI